MTTEREKVVCRAHARDAEHAARDELLYRAAREALRTMAA